MSKFENIEESINKLILSSTLWFKGKLYSLAPSKMKNSLSQRKDTSQQRKQQFKEKISHLKEQSIQKVVQSKTKVDNLKNKSLEVVDQARQTDIKSLNAKKVLLAIAIVFAPAFKKLKLWYLSLKPSSIASFISLATIGTLASVTIYVQSNKISEKAKRAPASELVEEVEQATAVSNRPGYYKRTEKQFQITNIVLPAYMQGNSHLKKLVIDFTFESSNKYIKQFLWQNPYLIQDTLNSNIEPIAIDFPLETEGKTIMKDKIKREMNDMLKRLKIKGAIKNVYIHSMIGA